MNGWAARSGRWTGGTLAHNRIGLNVYSAFWARLAGSDCEAFAFDVRVVTSQGDVIPDVVVACGERRDTDKNGTASPTSRPTPPAPHMAAYAAKTKGPDRQLGDPCAVAGVRQEGPISLCFEPNLPPWPRMVVEFGSCGPARKAAREALS
jgi:hypothetical protein